MRVKSINLLCLLRDVRGVDRHRNLDGLAFLALLSRPLMLLDGIEAFDNYFVECRNRLDDLAALTLVVSGQYGYCVSFLDMHGSIEISLYDLRRLGSDSPESCLTDFARDRAEDTAGNRFLLVLLDNDDCVLIETDV